MIRWPERFPGVRATGSNRFQRYFILAPLWSKISHFPFGISNTSQASQLFYQVYSKDILGHVSSSHAREVFDRVNKDVQQYQTDPSIPNFDASWILKVTWVRLYPDTYPVVDLVSSISKKTYPTAIGVKIDKLANRKNFSFLQSVIVSFWVSCSP